MGFYESQTARESRIVSIKSDVEILEKSVRQLGRLETEEFFIREAILEACQAALSGNYGIGAVISYDGNLIARGQNRLAEESNPLFHLLHAEMDALRNYHEQVPQNSRRHDLLTIYTTLEPCPMCTCGMLNAGVLKVVAGSADPWAGQLISHPNAMPPLWKELLIKTGTEHRIADVSEKLQEACRRIFMITKETLDATLVSRK